MEVRRVRPDEFEAAGEVTARAYHEFGPRKNMEWQDYFRQIADVATRASFAPVLVAVEEGAILGTLTLELDERIPSEAGAPAERLEAGRAHIRMLGVAPEARRRGAARALMEASIAEARAAGKTFLTLNTTPKMKAAQTMYESMGFVRGPDQTFDDGFCLLSYSLQL